MFVLPKASHHCHTKGNSNITATKTQNVQSHNTLGNLCVCAWVDVSFAFCSPRLVIITCRSVTVKA